MSHFLAHRSFYCVGVIITILAFSGHFLARVDESLAKREGGKMFLEHSHFVLNVRPNVSVTTFDDMACALECLRRRFCLSFNFGVYPGNGNCKLLREDKYTSSGRFQPSPFYHHYSIMSPCEHSPCKDGERCLPLYETNGFLCKRAPDRIVQATPWIKLNKDKVCFGAMSNAYGNFTIQSNGTLITIKLVYLSGFVTCNKHNVPYGSHWACKKDSNIATIVTNANNKVVLPHDYQNTSFALEGYHPNSSELVFNSLSPALSVTAGEEYRVWYHEDFQDGSESDNAGQTCIDVYARYM